MHAAIGHPKGGGGALLLRILSATETLQAGFREDPDCNTYKKEFTIKK
jgi:hypothetical protein